MTGLLPLVRCDDADQEMVHLRRTGRTDPLRAHRSQGTDVGRNKIDENLHVVTEQDIADEPGRGQEENWSTAATGLRRAFHICRIEGVLVGTSRPNSG